MKPFNCFLTCIAIMTLIFLNFNGCVRHPFYNQKQKLVIDLKKKIGIVAFDNRATKVLSLENLYLLYINIVKKMQEQDPSIQFETTDGFPEILKTTSRLLSTDHIDREALIAEARKKGYQALVWGRIHEIQKIDQKKGFIGLKKNKAFVSIRGEFSLFDCATQAKIWYAPMNINLAFEKLFKPDETIPNDLDDSTIGKAINQFSQIISEQMVKSLKDEPWKGFIVESSKDDYSISSGIKNGIMPHMTFDVIGAMGEFKGIYNQVYHIPGKPIGQIQITSVDNNSAKAISLFGNQLEKSICIRETEKQ